MTLFTDINHVTQPTFQPITWMLFEFHPPWFSLWANSCLDLHNVLYIYIYIYTTYVHIKTQLENVRSTPQAKWAVWHSFYHNVECESFEFGFGRVLYHSLTNIHVYWVGWEYITSFISITMLCGLLAWVYILIPTSSNMEVLRSGFKGGLALLLKVYMCHFHDL